MYIKTHEYKVLAFIQIWRGITFVAGAVLGPNLVHDVLDHVLWGVVVITSVLEFL